MTDQSVSDRSDSGLARRSFLAAAAGAVGLAASRALARDYGPDAQPVRYPEPDVVALDKRFKKMYLGNSPIQRLYHSKEMLWAEGPAWNGVGRYLLWSDIPNNVQMRWLEEDGHVSTFRNPAGNSNGNTFDYQGRQISCEHGTRRVVRYEYDGKVTVLAEKFGGLSLNAPNDLCFSPDYKKLYAADTGASHYDDAPKNIKVWDVTDEKKLVNGREFASMKLSMGPAKEGEEEKFAAGLADGIRCDIHGNIWASAGWVGDGYDGVHIFASDGVRIGQIRLPEICSNVCFGGTKRNRLFMTGSTSLYAVYVESRGAHIT